MAEKSKWHIKIPSQGIDVNARSKEEAAQFFIEEIAFYNLIGQNFNVVFAGSSYGQYELAGPAVEQLGKIVQEIRTDKTAAFQQYLADANARQILVGASPVGQHVLRLKESNDGNAASILACIYAPKWARTPHGAAKEIVSLFRAVAFANPANRGFDDLIDATEGVKDAHEADRLSQVSAETLEKFIEDKTKLIFDLETLYRTQLTIQEPAVSWENIARRKTKVWIGWLIAFGLMVIAPIVLALWFWDAVSSAIVKLTATNGGISISGLAAISIPALFYAWLLKNISRVFIQNLNLADDAAHRRSLALTYMGLLRDERHPATDQDRAIILNALFRPIPPQSGDEGPPSGVLELIKSK